MVQLQQPEGAGDMNSRLKSGYARITRTIEAGTASIVDVAWISIRGKLNDLADRPVATERVNSLVRGVLGVAIGLVILVWPDTSLAAMVVIIGVYAIIDGVLSLVVGLSRRSRRWQFVGQGVTSLAVGLWRCCCPRSRRRRCCIYSPYGWL
jgi:hypothetical protein